MAGLSAAAPLRRIGLTGGIGSGKSTVARSLQARGATLVDTDAIAHQLTVAGGAAMPRLIETFGSKIAGADGALARDRMREIAFADAGARQRLEAILHPMIGSLAQAQADACGNAVVVFDVPLLHATSPWRARCQRILVVDCSEATQIERVSQRSGWGEAQVRAAIASQAPRDARRAIADAVLHNDGLTLDELDAAVGRLWALWNNQ